MLKAHRIDKQTIQITSDEELFALSNAISVVVAEQPIKSGQVHFYSDEEWEKIKKNMAKIDKFIASKNDKATEKGET